MENDSKEGLTLYGFLVYLIEEKGLYILSFAIIFLIFGILFVHFNAKSGTKITILGIIEYTKGENYNFATFGNKSKLANDWLGSWKYTVDNASGPNSGIMFFYSPICADTKYKIFGFHENYKCKMTLLYGNLKTNGRVLEGIWENPYSGQKGTFLLNYNLINNSKSFSGNYAMDNAKIDENKNKWTGTKIN